MKLRMVYKGGPGSGLHGHAGRPGKQGGSAPEGAAGASPNLEAKARQAQADMEEASRTRDAEGVLNALRKYDIASSITRVYPEYDDAGLRRGFPKEFEDNPKSVYRIRSGVSAGLLEEFERLGYNVTKWGEEWKHASGSKIETLPFTGRFTFLRVS